MEDKLSLNISGLVGYTILLNLDNNKFIVLLGDVHDGVEYCKNDSFYIDSVLNKLLNKDDIKVFLEEVPRDGLELVELWPNAEHTQRLKKWFLNNQNNIIPIDIRPYLIPFSHQKYNMNMLDENEKNITMNDYLITLKSLFSLNSKPLSNSIKFFKNILNALEDKTTQKGIVNMYRILKKKFIKLISDINLLETFEITIKKNSNWFNNLEELKLNIMDWYTVLLLLGSHHSIVHLGLAHYLNVIYVLENNFKLKKIFQTGSTNLRDINNINACVKIL